MLDNFSKSLMRWLKNSIIQGNKDFLSIFSVKLYSNGALGSRGATHPKKPLGCLGIEKWADFILVDKDFILVDKVIIHRKVETIIAK